MAGGGVVAPLSIFPLFWLVVTWYPLYLVRIRTLPGELKPLLLFIYFVLISCGFAFFLDIPFYKENFIIYNELEALLTLGIGVAFLLVTISRVQSLKDVKESLVWINVGGILFLVWSMFQVIVIVFFNGTIPPGMDFIQKIISVSNLNGQISGVRISGLTLEPSWLAHSLNMLYIPVWLAASRYKISAFRFRFGKITVENILLLSGIIAMFMTYSRIGLVGFLAILAWFMMDAAKALSKKITAHKKDITKPPLLQRGLITGSLLVFLILVFMILIYALSLQDSRFKKLLNINSQNNNNFSRSWSLISLAKKINFGERVVYWDLGWKVFNEYPIFGVGLGNVGLFSEQLLSPEAWKMGEVRQLLLYEPSLPNTKNLWVRILSETGLVGFSFYSTWLIVLWFAGRNLYNDSLPGYCAIGLAGQFVIIAHLCEGFSLDTFALPYVWISFGILIASVSFRRKQILYEKQININPEGFP
jgi:hypothetical protein